MASSACSRWRSCPRSEGRGTPVRSGRTPLDAIEEEVAHEFFLRFSKPIFPRAFVVQHRIGETQHVEHDVSFLVRAHARMFWASSKLVAKIVAAMPNWKFACFWESACMASIVWQAFSKPRLTCRT